MAINPNWSRWVKMSLIKHITDGAPSGVVIFVEGQERNTEEEIDVIELRFDGPTVATMDGDLHRVYVEANVLVQLRMPFTNLYRPEQVTGQITALLGQEIAVYKYGAETGDDNSYVGCLTPVDDFEGRWLRDNVSTFNFGQVRPDAKLWQSAVEAHYRMFING
jgi:hypothetical protein